MGKKSNKTFLGQGKMRRHISLFFLLLLLLSPTITTQPGGQNKKSLSAHRNPVGELRGGVNKKRGVPLCWVKGYLDVRMNKEHMV